MVDFNPWKTLPEPYFIIPESLVAPCTVVFARIANKQTNKLNYIYTRLHTLKTYYMQQLKYLNYFKIVHEIILCITKLCLQYNWLQNFVISTPQPVY